MAEQRARCSRRAEQGPRESEHPDPCWQRTSWNAMGSCHGGRRSVWRTALDPGRMLRNRIPTQGDKTNPVRIIGAVEAGPWISITFPASPDYLRLARLATADVGSRAGLDYEEIDDLRIAVSELCSMISGAGDAVLTLEFSLDGTDVAVTGDARPGSLVDSDLSRAIVTAVVDEYEVDMADGVARFRAHKPPRRPGAEAQPPPERPADEPLSGRAGAGRMTRPAPPACVPGGAGTPSRTLDPRVPKPSRVELLVDRRSV